ncbi:MAG TPA: hypothetical protein VMW01_07055 [Williamwhitmania sp.]|nr:hypothetical protein [Williamwhitmania sp.]
MENRVSFSITPEVEQSILDAIAQIESDLPMLINLSAEDRHDLPKMGDKTLAFVTKSLEYAKQNPGVVPPFLNIPEFEKDVNAATSMSKILRPLKQLLERIDDTTMLTGSEAYSAALIFYGAVKGAAKADVGGMKTVYDDLQSRFPGRSKTAAPTQS